MITMGLPPKYGKAPTAPTEMMLSGRKRGSPSSWLNVEGSSGSTSGTNTNMMPPPRGGLPPIHRRSASESFTDNHLFKESHFFNAAAAGTAISKTRDNLNNNNTTTTIHNIDGRNKEEELGMMKKSSSPLSPPPLPPLPPLDDDSNKKKKVSINEEGSGGNSSSSGASIKSETETKMMNNSTTNNNIDFTQYKWGRKFDPNMDPKKIKRILANRLSAQKSRLKKLEYKAELEKTVEALQAEIGVLSPQVSHYDRQRFILRMENAAMKQKMAHLHNDKLIKEAQFRALKEETEKLKQIYMLQQQSKMEKEQQEKEQQSYNVNHINEFVNCMLI